MKIRNATMEDLEQIAAVEAECFPAAEAATEADIKERLAVYANHFWVMEEQGRIIGFVNGMVTVEADLQDEMYKDATMHREDGAWQMIFGVDTLPEYRNQGCAGRLLQYAIDCARQQGRKGLVLTCKEKLLHYYAKFGFENEGISESEHGGVAWYQMRLTFDKNQPAEKINEEKVIHEKANEENAIHEKANEEKTNKEDKENVNNKENREDKANKDNKENIMTKTIVVCLGAMLCCFLWGSAFPCVKIGYQLFAITGEDTASQILFAGYRFTLAGILTVLIGSIISRKFLYPQRRAYGKVFGLSLLQTVIQYLFFYIGLANTSGVKASIIEAVNVFVAIMVASLIFRQEKLTGAKLLGCAVGFAGVILINMSGLDFQFQFRGEGFIFLSTVAYAFSSVFMKRFSKTENPVMLSGYQFVVGGIIMSVVGLLMGGNVQPSSPGAVGLLIYMAMISAVAYSIWSILLKYNPVSKVAVFGFMNPVFGVILSAWLLQENQALGMLCVLSLVLVCIGIYIVNRPDKGTA